MVTVVTGAVNTNALSTGLNFKLPPTSVYKSIEKEIADRANGRDGTPRMEPSVYAEKVVDDVLRGANWQVWRGGYASTVHLISSYFPSSLSVSLSIPILQLQRLTLDIGLDVEKGDWVGSLQALIIRGSKLMAKMLVTSLIVSNPNKLCVAEMDRGSEKSVNARSFAAPAEHRTVVYNNLCTTDMVHKEPLNSNE